MSEPPDDFEPLGIVLWQRASASVEKAIPPAVQRACEFRERVRARFGARRRIRNPKPAETAFAQVRRLKSDRQLTHWLLYYASPQQTWFVVYWATIAQNSLVTSNENIRVMVQSYLDKQVSARSVIFAGAALHTMEIA